MTPRRCNMGQKPFEEYLEGNRKVKLSSGKEVEVPPLTWGRELKIYKALTEVLKKLAAPVDTKTGEVSTVTSDQMYSFLLTFVDEATNIAALVFDQDAQWVTENLTSSDMTEFVLPLSLNIFNKLSKGMTDAFTALSTLEKK